MLYFLVASYNIHDMILDEGTDLYGPFLSKEEREEALKKEMGKRDLETGEIVNITLLEVVTDRKLIRTGSYVPGEDGNMVECDEEEDEFDD